MKIKPMKDSDYILNITRYSNLIDKTHLLIKNGIVDEDKKEYGNIVLLSLMNICGFKCDEEESNEIINKKIDDIDIFGIVDDYKINDIIEFDNDDYIVLDIINIFDNTYLFLINFDKFKNDTAIIKVKKSNGINKYMCIDDDHEFNIVLNKIFIDFKDDLLKYYDNE